MAYESSNPGHDHPITALAPEDLDLIVQLVLHSGSLKDLAASYSVSYPTIRVRLDRVIERLRAVLAGRGPDPVSELLADLIERGEITTGAARKLRSAIKQLNGGGSSASGGPAHEKGARP